MSKIQLSNQALSQIINTLPVGLLLTNNLGEIVYANSKAEEIFGFKQGELSNLSIDKLIPEQHKDKHRLLMSTYIKTPLPGAMNQGRILSAMTKTHDKIQIEVGLSPITLNKQCYVLATIIEASNQILKIAAYNDPLTGLPNRTLFMELSESLRHLAIRKKDPLTILFIDLDNFKDVNDQYGHDIGDLVLCKTSDILNNSIRKNDIVGRIGGDEFLICLYGIKSARDIKTISNNIRKKISDIKSIKECKINITASIGAISTSNIEKLSLDEMIKIADKTMYDAKKSGKNKVIFQQL